MEVEGIETAWKLECFPNGKQKIGEDTAGAVSVFLYPANTTAINRQFSFAIGWVEQRSRAERKDIALTTILLLGLLTRRVPV